MSSGYCISRLSPWDPEGFLRLRTLYLRKDRSWTENENDPELYRHPDRGVVHQVALFAHPDAMVTESKRVRLPRMPPLDVLRGEFPAP